MARTKVSRSNSDGAFIEAMTAIPWHVEGVRQPHHRVGLTEQGGATERGGTGNVSVSPESVP
ncbi:MAG: hypothetical protein IPO12_09240 [Flavobacteriales bacterium]|nr:hypothetical protein [Flavobacteriales bacterium]